MTGISEKGIFFFFFECFTIAFLNFSWPVKPASSFLDRHNDRWIYASNSVRLSHFGRVKEGVAPDFTEINRSFIWTQTKWSYSAHMPNLQSNGSCKTVLLPSCQQLDLVKVPPAFWEGVLFPRHLVQPICFLEYNSKGNTMCSTSAFIPTQFSGPNTSKSLLKTLTLKQHLRITGQKNKNNKRQCDPRPSKAYVSIEGAKNSVGAIIDRVYL